MATKRSCSGHHQKQGRRSRSHHLGGDVKAPPPTNNFANDGSFMDMFKKRVASNASVGGEAGAADQTCSQRPTTDAGGSNTSTVTTTTCISEHADERPKLMPALSVKAGTDRALQLRMATNTTLRHRTYAAAATTYVHAGISDRSGIMGPRTTPPSVGLGETTATAAAAASVTKAVEQKDGETAPKLAAVPKRSSLLSFVGRRRGGKTLPTGMVIKKAKKDAGAQVDEGRTDAWSQYMAEVRKYKEMSCEDEGKTRPLVK